METDSTNNQNAMVTSLASTIHQKIIAPASGKANALNMEILSMKERILVLENELSLLALAQKRTWMIACAAAAGLVLLVILLIIPAL